MTNAERLRALLTRISEIGDWTWSADDLNAIEQCTADSEWRERVEGAWGDGVQAIEDAICDAAYVGTGKTMTERLLALPSRRLALDLHAKVVAENERLLASERELTDRLALARIERREGCARLARLEGNDLHPENRCQRCGGRNVCWHAESSLWNSVAAGFEILCPICFVQLAEAAGHKEPSWRVGSVNYSAEHDADLTRMHAERVRAEAAEAALDQARAERDALAGKVDYEAAALVVQRIACEYGRFVPAAWDRMSERWRDKWRAWAREVMDAATKGGK